MDPRLEHLRERWLASGAFADEQAYLHGLVDLGGADLVFLDPDGTAPPWLAVVIRRRTNVVYASQCAGICCDQRLVEGYLVPLGGSKSDFDGGKVMLQPLTDIFHDIGGCQSNWRGGELPASQRRRLARLVGEIPFWHCQVADRDQPRQLRLDESRIDEVAEAWIPVKTPYGRGVLLHKNCD